MKFTRRNNCSIQCKTNDIKIKNDTIQELFTLICDISIYRRNSHLSQSVLIHSALYTI